MSLHVLIRDILQKCIEEYSGILLSLPNDTAGIVRLQAERLRVWAGTVGVFASEKASVDYRLRNDPNTRAVIIGILSRIIRAGTERGADKAKESDRLRTREVSTPENNDNEDDAIHSGSESLDDSGGSSTSGNSEMPVPWVRTIKTLIDKLFLLASVIRRPIRYQDNSRISQLTVDGPDLEDLNDLASHVRFQLRGKNTPESEPGPDCPSETLTQRLVDAAVFRKQRFVYKNKHAQKLKQGTSSAFQALLNPPSALISTNLSPDIGGQSEDVAINSPTMVITQDVAYSVAFSSTIASSVYPLAKKVEAPTPSIISQSAIFRHNELDFPSVPRLEADNDCICPYCFLPLEAATRAPRHWRRHVLHDLEPYQCLFEPCADGQKLYDNMNDCLHHMQWKHSAVWACGARGHENVEFQNPAQLEDHLNIAHGSSFSKTQIQTLLSKSTRPTEYIFGRCPICGEDMQLEPAAGRHGAAADVSQDLIRTFRNHVSKHLEFLALLSLPPRSDNEGDAESNVRQDESTNSSDHVEVLSFTDRPADDTLPSLSSPFSDEELTTSMIPDAPTDETWTIPQYMPDDIVLPPYRDPTLAGFMDRARQENLSSGSHQQRAVEQPVRQPRSPPSFEELEVKPTSKYEGSKNFVTHQRYYPLAYDMVGTDIKSSERSISTRDGLERSAGRRISVLFCDGNNGRLSKLAQGIFRSRGRSSSRIGTVDSAGVYTPSRYVSEAVTILAKYGITFDDHTARQIGFEDFEMFDYVFGMNSGQLGRLQDLQRRAESSGYTNRAKVMLFGAYGGGAITEEVVDPLLKKSTGVQTQYQTIHPNRSSSVSDAVDATWNSTKAVDYDLVVEQFQRFSANFLRAIEETGEEEQRGRSGRPGGEETQVRITDDEPSIHEYDEDAPVRDMPDLLSERTRTRYAATNLESFDVRERPSRTSDTARRRKDVEPSSPLGRLYALQDVFYDSLLPDCQHFIEITPTDPKQRNKDYVRLSETVLKDIVLAADFIEIQGDEDARSERKRLITDANAVFKELDAKAGRRY